MEKFLALFLTLLSLSLSFTVGCSTSQPERPQPAEEKQVHNWDEEKTLASLKVGASREEIDRLLGQPMMVTETASGITCAYMLGMNGFQMPGSGANSAMNAMGALSGAVGSLGMLGGPAGAIGAGIGSQALGIGSSLMAAANTPAMPDMEKMRMVMVEYRNGKVVSIQKMNPSAMGSAPMEEE